MRPMSRHWNPRRGGGWAGQWDRHRWNVVPLRRRRRLRLPRFSRAEIRLTVTVGLILGLLLWPLLRIWPAAPVRQAPAAERQTAIADPYAEARRSQAILSAQEGAPDPHPMQGALPARGSTGAPLRAVGAVHVIDGDTFDHGGTRIRIADIDTPEVNGRCPYETQLAARATQRLRTLLAAGPFELHPLGNGRDVDRYGRRLRIVTRGGRSLGDVLVAEGLARTWTGRREPWC